MQVSFQLCKTNRYLKTPGIASAPQLCLLQNIVGGLKRTEEAKGEPRVMS